MNKNSKLVSISTFNLNKGGVNLIDKLPDLVGKPFSISLQKNTEYYIAEVYFNYAINWITLRIKDSQNNIIQGDTNVLDYPYNLILTPELNDYGLFYFKNTSEFKFYELGSSWYNTIDLNYWQYKEKMLKREVF
ncbi:TPA: hypothetical protein RTG57_001738 [Campylobacter jejuni]|nr:hypothetical protein [Campylobacter jejuni]